VPRLVRERVAGMTGFLKAGGMRLRDMFEASRPIRSGGGFWSCLCLLASGFWSSMVCQAFIEPAGLLREFAVVRPFE